MLLRYRIAQEPQGDVYRRLISVAKRECSSFLLVVHPDPPLSYRGQELMQRLGPPHRAIEDATEWPGTKYLGKHPPTVYEWLLSDDTTAVLLEATDRLYGWLQPSLPEDLAMLREDGEAWLTTTSHENEALLVLSEDAAQSLIAEIGDLSLESEASWQ